MEILCILGVTLFILILGVIISFIIFRCLGLSDGCNLNLLLKKPKDTNTNSSIEASVTEKEYNTAFKVLLFLWAIFGVYSLFSNFLSCVLAFSIDDSELKLLSITVIILNLILIVGIMLVLYYDKLGAYLLTVVAVLNFLILTFTQDLFSGLVGSLGFALFYILFFTLKKNGVTAYKLLFNNK